MTLHQYRSALRALDWISPDPATLAKLREAQPRLDPDRAIWLYYRALR